MEIEAKESHNLCNQFFIERRLGAKTIKVFTGQATVL